MSPFAPQVRRLQPPAALAALNPFGWVVLALCGLGFALLLLSTALLLAPAGWGWDRGGRRSEQLAAGALTCSTLVIVLILVQA